MAVDLSSGADQAVAGGRPGLTWSPAGSWLADVATSDAGLRQVLHGLPGVDQVGAEARTASLATRSIKKGAKLAALELAVRMVDLTTLEGADTPGKVRGLCAKALQPDPADPAVPPEKARELFALWLKRSVRHEIADVVFVAAVEGRPVSYISGSLTNGLGSIGLVGVHEEARKRGIGLAMVRHLLEWFRQRGAAKITVVTQGRNSGSQRVYQRCGFVTQSVRVWFHRWFGQA